MSEDNEYSGFAAYDDNGNVVGGSSDDDSSYGNRPMAGWYDDLWGSYNNFVDRRYDYRTDPSKLPKFDDFVGAQQKAHADHFGVPLNRPWNADVDIARAKTETIDSPFLAAVAEYNSLYGTNYQVDPAFLGANSRAGVNPYMDSQPMRNRNESGFFKQGPGKALLAAAAIAAGGWGLSGLAEGTAAGLTGVGESIMAGGYGANLAASGAGFGAGATGLSLAELGAGSLLGGGAGSVLAGGAGALGLSAETVAAMQALGYSGAEIASMGGNVLNGFDATQALSAGGSLPTDVPPGVPRPDSSYNPDASSTGPSSTTNPTGPLSVFDKFLNGILDNPIKSALSAGQILSGISTANKAMSPQQAQAMADPFSPYRQQYINQLNAVMANPALAMSQPGYQFQRQQGEQAIDRKLAVRGMGSYTPDGRGSASGGADIARMKYGQEYALGSYNDYVKQLSGLAGATQAPGVGGQAALNAQTAAANAATQGWSAINQGIGTMQGIMNAAPSGNPNNSGWSTPATPGFQGAFPGGVPWSDMPAYSGGDVPSNTALQQPPAGSYASGTSGGWGPYSNWFTPPERGQRGYAPPGYMVGPLDNIITIEDYNALYGNKPTQPAYDTGWD